MTERTSSLVASLALAALIGVAAQRPAAAQDAAADQPPPLAAAPVAAPVHRRPAVRVSHRSVARPLTVSRRAAPPPAFIEPGPGREFAGPAAIAVMPIQTASQIVEMPFHALGTVFPPTGDPSQNVLVLVGLPIRAVGDLAQVPFHMVEAPFRVDAPSLF